MKLRLMACALVLASSIVSAETLTNDSVISLWRAGLGESLIMDKIRSESCGYDVSIVNLVMLKKTGLPENVISEMVRRCATVGQQRGLTGDDSSADPRVRHSPGIYLMADWLPQPKLSVLRPSKASGVKASGNGSILFPFMTKLIFSGSNSRNIAQTPTPNFYFYFNPSDEKVSDFGMENSVAAQSPDEFSLVHFKVKGSNREVTIGKMSAFSGSKGVDAKFTIPINVSETSSGTFKATTSEQLLPGEYAFIFTGANGAARIYDFSVK